MYGHLSSLSRGEGEKGSYSGNASIHVNKNKIENERIGKKKQTVLIARQRKFLNQACIMMQGKFCGSILSLFKILFSTKIFFSFN